MLLRKNESSLEKKIVSLKEFFQASRNPVRKKKVCRQNSVFRGYHEFHVNSHKNLEILIMATSILLLTRVIL